MAAIETNLRQAEVLHTKMNEVRERLERYLNLQNHTDSYKTISPKGSSKLMRICLLAGLSDNSARTEDYLNISLASNSISPTLFTVRNLSNEDKIPPKL